MHRRQCKVHLFRALKKLQRELGDLHDVAH